MKTLNKYIAGISTAAVLLTAMSCSKTFYSDKNINPNAPASVLPNTLLTPVEVSLAYTVGGDMSRFSSMYDQQTTGVSRQCQAYNQYIFTNQDIEQQWDNMYTATMYNDYHLMQACSNGKYNAYKGIAEVLMAYSLQVTVDGWGKIPYSQAFQGGNNLTPAYDNDASVYAAAKALCYSGISDLNNTANDLLHPGDNGDDVIYGGNTGSWIKFAYAIMARMEIHQSQTGTGNMAMADSALAHANMSFSSNADNAQVMFGTAASNNAPNYQFVTQRGDISYAFSDGFDTGAGFFYKKLLSTKDPRKNFLVDSVDEINGNIYGGVDNSYYQLYNSPVEFICYDEVQFIAAEAALRTGGPAQGYYTAAIQANMNKLAADSSTLGLFGQLGLSNQTLYLAQPGVGILSGNTDSAYAQIAYQEYVALYLNPEAWAVWRRSTKIPGFPNGSPALSPVSGPYTSNGIPRRYLYPQSELNLNAANVPSATQWSPKVFWDN